MATKRWQLYAAIVALALIVGVTFSAALSAPFHAFDDTTFILRNRLIVSPDRGSLADFLFTPTVGYVVPLTVALEALLYKVGGGAPSAFHLCGLLLHLLNVLLVFFAARRRDGALLILALAASLAFGLHPIVAEPVAWATGLKDLLAAALALSACVLFLDAMGAATKMRLLPAALLATLAVLAKPTVGLIGLAWIAFLWLRRGLAPLAPALKITAATTAIVAGGVTLLSKLAHDTLISAAIALPTGGWPALTSLGYHARHLLWPAELHPYYFVDRQAGFRDPHTFAGALILTGFCFALWRARRRETTLFWLLVAGAAYLPVSSVIPFPRFIGDSYLYLPLAALALAAASLIEGQAIPRRARPLIAAFCALLFLSLGIRTTGQVQRWRSAAALWGPVTDRYEGQAEPWSLLAQGWAFESRPDVAAAAYGQAFARRYLPQRLTSYARALINARRRAEGECVLVEQMILGPKKRQAASDLALLLVTAPDYRPRHPAAAAHALAVVRRLLDRGRLGPRYSPYLNRRSIEAKIAVWQRLRRREPGKRRLTTTSAAALFSSWRPRGCAALRHRRTSAAALAARAERQRASP